MKLGELLQQGVIKCNFDLYGNTNEEYHKLGYFYKPYGCCKKFYDCKVINIEAGAISLSIEIEIK